MESPVLKIGVDLIPAEHAMQGETPRWSDLLEMARTAEAVGFSSIWVPDHFIFPTAHGGSSGTWECWSLVAALAAATSRVELGTLVLGAGYRNPALLAKMADTVDEVSGGRLILGVGSGWLEYEYRAFGYPPDHKVSRFEEAIQIIRGLLKDGAIDFSGRFYEARNCELRPRSSRPGGPPLMIASRSPRMHKIAARYGDWWNGSWSASVEQFRPKIAAIDAACDAVGRDPATLPRTAGVIVSLPGDYPHRDNNPFWTSMKNMAAGETLTGTPDQIVEELLGYRDLGVEHIQVILDPMTVEGIERLAPILQRLRA
jgi:probable F420-dependent oxidoreductase